MGEQDRGRRAGSRHHGIATIAVMATAALPFLVTRLPPLHDWPNHLARAHILHARASEPAFQRAFDVEWHPYPNLAADLALGVLIPVLGTEAAGRVFLISLPLLLVLGADRLTRAIHVDAPGPPWMAPLAGFFCWNAFVLYGFVSYVFGLGVFLLALAAWIHAYRTRAPWRVALATAGATGAYLSHATSFAFLAIAAFAWVASERRRPWLPSLAAAGVPLVPGLLIRLFGGVPRAEGAVLIWDGPAAKMKGAAMVIATYGVAWDLVTAALFAAAAALLFRRAPSRSRPALTASALLLAAFVLSPSQAEGGWAVDRRFLLPALLLAICAFTVSLGARAQRIAFALALSVVLARSIAVAATFRTLGADLERRATLLDAVPRGASVHGLPCVDRHDKAAWTRQMGLVYLHQYAAVRRNAVVSSLFAHPNQQPLRTTLRSVPGLDDPRTPGSVDWSVALSTYDYVFASNLDDRRRHLLTARCRVVAERADAALFGACSASKPR